MKTLKEEKAKLSKKLRTEVGSVNLDTFPKNAAGGVVFLYTYTQELIKRSRNDEMLDEAAKSIEKMIAAINLFKQKATFDYAV